MRALRVCRSCCDPYTRWTVVWQALGVGCGRCLWVEDAAIVAQGRHAKLRISIARLWPVQLFHLPRPHPSCCLAVAAAAALLLAAYTDAEQQLLILSMASLLPPVSSGSPSPQPSADPVDSQVPIFSRLLSRQPGSQAQGQGQKQGQGQGQRSGQAGQAAAGQAAAAEPATLALDNPHACLVSSPGVCVQACMRTWGGYLARWCCAGLPAGACRLPLVACV